MSDPKRILLVRLSHLGDVVHALVVFHALHAAYPRAEIAWAIQPEFAGLLAGLPGLARVVTFERGAGLGAWPRLRRELRDFGADWAVDAQGNAKSAGVVLCSGAGRRSGLARREWRERPFGLVLNDPAPAVDAPGLGPRHAMHRMLGLARHVASGATSARLDPAVRADELAAGHARLDALVARSPGDADRAVVLKLSSQKDIRGWPLARWAELARSLREDGRPVLLLSGPAEREEGRQLEAELNGTSCDHWIDQDGLRELAGFFAAAGERGLPLAACDSGPMHLAAACGQRVVVLEGPQDGARTGPWPLEGSGPHRVLRAGIELACAPCLARRCTHPNGPVCLSELQASEVRAALEASPT